MTSAPTQSAPPTKPRGNLVPDFIAGLTTGVANIPDAMASSILAGVSPVQGLYAIMVGTPLGALFSSSAFMNIATTSALSITAGSALAGYSVEQRPSAITTLALVTGVMMVVAGLLRLGRLLRFISNSVVIGFLTGVSINVILSQVGDFTGYSSEYSNKVVKAIDTLLHLRPNRPADDSHRPADGCDHPAGGPDQAAQLLHAVWHGAGIGGGDCAGLDRGATGERRGDHPDVAAVAQSARSLPHPCIGL